MKVLHPSSTPLPTAAMIAALIGFSSRCVAQDAAPPVPADSDVVTIPTDQPDRSASTQKRKAASPPIGTQHLISPGEDWGAVIRKAAPGDQILLMPGEHRSLTIEGGGGSPEAPVVVRPLDPSQPVVIRGNRYGIRLRNVHDVVLENIIVRSATLRGITIDNGEANPAALFDDEAGFMVDWAPTATANVVLRNVRIERVGPTGQRPAVLIQHVSGVEIADCVIEGWGGAAIEIVGSRDINVHDTTFTPLDDHSQLNGVSMRAASSDVHVHNCRFNGITESVFALGGSSKAVEFIAPADDDSEDSANAFFDARGIVIERNVLTDCAPAFVIGSVADAELIYNTIIRPRRHVVVLATPAQDQLPLQSPVNLTFGYNLITWQAGDLTAYAAIDEGYPVEAITLGRNLWWSAVDAESSAPDYGPFPGPEINPQLIKLNPMLDGDLRPNNPEARVFGHRAKQPQ